jgi:6-phosphogluconate dehydrogenase
MSQSDIGLIGLAVMGQNLALNIADHGYTISVFNRTTSVTHEWMEKLKKEEPAAPRVIPTDTLQQFVQSLKKPRKVIILVKAGGAVDAVVQQLIEAGIERDDIVVDAGNSLWTDTIRREKQYADKLKFFGSGVSGGELGARFGPSLMPGGDPESWKHLEPIWKAIAAKVDAKTGAPLENYAPGKPVEGGVPCTAYIGPNGAGHYVKMVHNGIEYIDMQLICEAYDLMQKLLGLEPDEMAEVFSEWNDDELSSYLIQITADILQQRDPAAANAKKAKFLVDVILDTAGQKGTGKWTSVNALDMGIPANALVEAVLARCMSAIKDERVVASKQLKGPKAKKISGKKKLIKAIRDALYCSKICAYAQGFQLMREAQNEYKWKLDFGTIASIFRGGCIIRARFLQKITEAYESNPDLVNLLLDPYFKKAIQKGQEHWRKVVQLAAANGVPAPAFMSALAYYDSYRSARLPANLLQAQRDYFGAHTYDRLDSRAASSSTSTGPKPPARRSRRWGTKHDYRGESSRSTILSAEACALWDNQNAGPSQGRRFSFTRYRCGVPLTRLTGSVLSTSNH